MVGLVLLGSAHAQVGVNNEDPAATMDITATKLDNSTAEGVIAPRLSLTQLASKDGKYLPAQTGCIVYVNDVTGSTTIKTTNVKAVGYYYFDGTVWLNMSVDNLGNHTATQALNMASNNITNIFNAYVKNEAQIADRTTTNTNYFGLYKNNGTFGIYNSKLNNNAISVDESTSLVTMTANERVNGTLAIGNIPSAGSTNQVLTADASGNVQKTTIDLSNIPLRYSQTLSNVASTAAATADFSAIRTANYTLTVTTSNACGRNGIASFTVSNSVITFLGGQARNIPYTYTVTDPNGNELTLTANFQGCGDGGGNNQFNFIITIVGKTVKITNSGSLIPQTYVLSAMES